MRFLCMRPDFVLMLEILAADGTNVAPRREALEILDLASEEMRFITHDDSGCQQRFATSEPWAAVE